MENIANRLEFAPPRDKGSLRAFGLALLVHILLIAALTWGVNWKRSDDAASFEAELWSGAVQPAAPSRIEAPPVPPPAPVPPAGPAPPAPPPPPVARAPEVRETPPLPDVDIALEREKKRKLLQQQKQAEIRQAEKLQEKRDAELQARKVKELAERQAQALAQKAEAKKQAARELAIQKEKEKRTAVANAAAAAAAEKQREAALEKHKTLAAATAAANAEKQKLAAAAAAKQKQAAEAAAAAEKQRQAAIQQRIMSMAGAAGSGSSGAAKASGPSAGYAGRVRAKVLPNVVFTDEISGNPKAEVEVTTTSDGTIMSQRLAKSSGNKAWDDAVIKAIVRTGSLPRDVDGRVPTPMIIEFRPN